MKLLGILPFARFLLEQALKPGDIAIDCTIGKGNDTVFLANLVGETGHVYGFDIQKEAISFTTERLLKHQINDVSLYQLGHENVGAIVPVQEHHRVRAAIFNLGYLPGGDKSVVTKPESTITAIKGLFKMMASGGIIVLVIYHGHEEGKKEKESIDLFVENFSQQEAHILSYQFINQANNPPYIVAIEKR
ncbi:tRNA (mnm(5)s(2)U34)-methyltransferase [Bacillus suaedae]|uniref:Class I SAM-dependent methyltransferase n=1 Tax=Halalkalibacter suaedae TaxID=2822140 RepID=A0A940WX43_9BACI|nr:class I SAM-dependent methyltransferase [Bacillus suaedae]MBP3949830.1 class I SAM-dependent methyltransferase [Bacillus suaedae]